MERTYSAEFVKQAHKATIFHENDPHKEKDLEWWDETNPKGKTIVCPECGIDCIIGDASGLPVTDTDFIIICSEAWFGGISAITSGWPLSRRNPVIIEVD